MTPLDTITGAYDRATAAERVPIRLWMREQLAKRNKDGQKRKETLFERVGRFPKSMDPLTIAHALRVEGFYAPSTMARDIARRVEKIRNNGREA